MFHSRLGIIPGKPTSTSSVRTATAVFASVGRQTCQRTDAITFIAAELYPDKKAVYIMNYFRYFQKYFRETEYPDVRLNLNIQRRYDDEYQC
jgi:hypothetical protein